MLRRKAVVCEVAGLGRITRNALEPKAVMEQRGEGAPYGRRACAAVAEVRIEIARDETILRFSDVEGALVGRFP